ncbi:Exonuclease domain-containing protein [Mycena venus]|uniref:Exonuclease domain-containing protein n=1 Tax=Mycena venus TaxID=2733690 RepID=A0A8H6Y5S2_9AGAR|nr:Exonuclease domain-containing protein [Mycena venus]
MFSSLQLFQQLSCPDNKCSRPGCLYSHRTDLPPPPTLVVPVEQPVASSSSNPTTIPAKRPGTSTSAPSSSASQEPPRKQQKITSNRAAPVPQQATTGPPVLRVNGAQSVVPVPVRQAMLKTLFDHFVILYAAILPTNPTLASEHALRQEEELYKKSNKQTYRVAVIQCAAALKRRPLPDTSSHPSIGTEEEVIARAEALKSRKSLRLTRAKVEHLIVSKEDLELWGFILDIPDGVGGDQPSLENKIAKCDRCGKPFTVKRKDEADECIYHWGKPITRTRTTSGTGQRERVFRCCYRPAPGDDEGCTHGPHVFYESKPEDLHSRHAFSYLKPPPSPSTVLDVAALDCEMIYTTGGMRVARVSVVDGAGNEVLDELVRMDDGVEIIDFNTRFSGITEADYAKAVLPLSSIRESLDSIMNTETVLIGHALDNDLNTLRIVHHNVVDTALIFKHSAGPPYRKALKDLAREHLGITIQSGGGSVGHSSVEDSIATLDLMSVAFGQSDPNILKSSAGTDFNQFKFKSIGKEPELLKRISSYEQGVHYQYSPSPEPEGRYQYSPSPEPQAVPAQNEARTRPSLLQALTNNTSESQTPPFPTVFERSLPTQQPVLAEVESPAMDDESMQLHYPETPAEERPATTILKRNTLPPPPPPPPPFVPNYTALKQLHTRLETAHKVLAAPPPPKKAPTPLPEFPRPSLIAANNTLHHTEKLYTSAKEAVEASQARTATSEQGVAAAQTLVDHLTQALAAARTALELAQKTLLEARQAAEEAQAALLSSRASADAAEETKRLLEEPPPPRAPTPEPVNDNEELIGEMKKDLDSLRIWVEEQEAGHLPAAVVAVGRDISRDREEEPEEREASKMVIAPDDTDTDGEVRDANNSSAPLPATGNPAPDSEGQTDMKIEPRRLEEDAAQALVALAEQTITAQNHTPTSFTKDSVVKVKPEPVQERLPIEEVSVAEAALAREAALRKQQEARREQVRIQKEQAHAAAALSILKERQDAAAKSKTAAQSTPPPSNGDIQQQSGNVDSRNAVLPPTQAKVKAKKSKPVSGGVKLGPEVTGTVELCVSTDTAASSEPSPALERAAALGLRVRPNLAKAAVADPPAPSSKPKKARNHSLPPVSHLDNESPSLSPKSAEITAYRTGSDPGDIPIIPTAPEMPLHVSTDVQLMNLRFALQDGVTWEAISRSRPQLPGIKTEEREDDLRPAIPSSDTQAKPAPALTPQRPPPADPPITTPIPSAPVVTAAPTVASKPLPSRKHLPKFNKTTPQTGITSNSQAPKSAITHTAAQPRVMPRSNDVASVHAQPAETPPVTISSKRPPTVSAAAPDVAPGLTRAKDLVNGSNSHPVPPPSPKIPFPFKTKTNAGSGVSTTFQDSNGPSDNGPLSGRVSGPTRGRSPPRYPRSRSRTPDRDRYGGRVSNTYASREPERYSRQTPEPSGRRTPDWAGPPSPPSFYNNEWSPPGRSPSPLRSRHATPPRQWQRTESSAKRTSSDHYSPDRYSPHRPSAPAAFYSPRQDSPPKGPRQIPRAPSHNHKRARDEEYTTPFHAQKRFKDDGRDVSAASSRSLNPEMDRPSLENRLAASSDPNVHFTGRGESYRPAVGMSAHYDEYDPRQQGLLSRLSDPGPIRGNNSRGRGGTRGRGNKMRGRGRGGSSSEMSLVDRLL